MTGRLAAEVERRLAAGEPVVLVTVDQARGSTPRAAGTCMAVTMDSTAGTIGGGRLEWEATGHARDMIARGETSEVLDMALGPSVGQCCGGHVVLRLDRADADALAALTADEARARQDAPQAVVFGAGHVGKALVRALEPLPIRVSWSDTRPDQFPADTGATVEIEHSDPLDLVNQADTGAAVVAMTHSHALDYAITAEALNRGDLAYVGMIGSRTKRRRFERWFTARGGDPRALHRLVCPIGEVGVIDKRPEVIAAFVAAETMHALALWQARLDEPMEDDKREASAS